MSIPGYVRGVIVTPAPIETAPNRHVLSNHYTPTSLFDLQGWSDLSLPHALGIPLKGIGLGDQEIFPARNREAECLTLLVDPKDPGFGFADRTTVGSLLVCRKDGTPFNCQQMDVLQAYSAHRLHEVFDAPQRKERGEVVDAEEIAGRLLTPEAFVEYFEEYKKEMVKTDASWAKVKCPVQLPAKYGVEVCGACGGKEGKEGAVLLQCAKCKGQKYCSKECQKEDWKRHKSGCVASK